MDLDEDETITFPLRPPLQNSSSPRDEEPLASDLEKLKQWQEERMQRKLRGEYESAVTHLAELVSAGLSSY
jgi:outer membrane protein insertion porin family